ncbi:LacI family DNA-binding transcriptional regulator [Microbacterium sp. STN6]|uniref:LacI family DNA-binding transcriptional regulator n=1 Tax=Microbacterium sp. STN6 TaxID=2995588 RepID=UPI0022608449|nr:LacI family DNA-binding transcriptional regulator [Microbacterium sp. STN6]MCX7523170.1 LacI family DNA-binding transcriptional regulator [Microbacterium sp. STN6]
MATTIRQVAAAAGVSIATASRALSGSDAVVASTKQRVLEVAQRLDYLPSRLGRSLATGTTGNVGVILPDVTNPFYTEFLAELESALGARDIGVLVGDSHETPELERRLIQRMATQVDQLVLASSRLDDGDVAQASARLPVLLANRMLGAETPAPATLRQVTIDVEPGFREAVHHLRELGHAAITYIDGPPQSWSGRQKARVLETVCGELSMPLTTVQLARPDFGGGRDAGARVLEGAPNTTAIIAFNDQVALGLLSALRERGLDVPGDVSVVGCDDSLPEGMAWPALTTVDSSSRMLGARAAAAILEPGAPQPGSVPTRLIVRASTGRSHTAGIANVAGREAKRIESASAPPPVEKRSVSRPHPPHH